MMQKIKKHPVFFWVSAAVSILMGVLIIYRAKYQPDFAKQYDPYDYAMVGSSILNGEGITLNGKPYVLLPPGLSLISAAIQTVASNPEVAIKITSIVFWIIGVFLFYRILGFFFSEEKYRFIGLMFFCTIPGLFESAAAGRVETVFLAMIMLMMIFLFSELKKTKNDFSIRIILLISVLIAAVYYLRPEGLWIGFILWGIFLFHFQNSMTKKIIASLAMAGAVLLLIFPYLLFLKNHTGRWQISGKSYANFVMGELESPYQLGVYTGGKIPDRYQIIQRVIHDPTQAKSFYEYIDERAQSLFSRLPYNIYRIGYYLWFAFSPIGLILILYGALTMPAGNQIWIWGIMSVWLMYLLFFILPRVLSIYHPFLIVWMMHGIKIINERLNQKYSARTSGIILVPLIVALLLYQSRSIWRILGA